MIEALQIKAKSYKSSIKNSSWIETELKDVLKTFGANVIRKSDTNEWNDNKWIAFTYYAALLVFYGVCFPIRKSTVQKLSTDLNLSIVLTRFLLSTFADAQKEANGFLTYVQLTHAPVQSMVCSQT